MSETNLEASSDQQASDTQSVTVIKASQVAKYLKKCVPALLEDDDSFSPALDIALKDQQSVENIRKFITDPQIRAIIIERTSTEDEEADQEMVSYIISTDVRFSKTKINSVVLIKRGAVVEADKSVASQVRVLNLSDGSPYETLHAYISNAVGPYFKSFVKESGKAERHGDKMAPWVEKKMAELEMGLLHLQHNIDNSGNQFERPSSDNEEMQGQKCAPKSV